MARIDLANIRHAYGPDPQGEGDYALRRINQGFEDGGAYALLGPSGCGKTSLLNIISGLVQPTQGRVRFNGEDVTELPTEKRNIAHDRARESGLPAAQSRREARRSQSPGK
jgi:glycerol transport system ATP-binding protein